MKTIPPSILTGSLLCSTVFSLLTASITTSSPAAEQLPLAFTTKKIIVNRTSLAERYINFEFNFSNPNKTDVIIKEVGVSCTCTSYELDSSTIKAGASGTIRAKIDLKGKSGKVAASIILRTSSEAEPILLSMATDTGVAQSDFEGQSRFLVWRIGQDAVEQRVALKIPPELLIDNPRFDINHVSFNARIERDPSDISTYWIIISPRGTDKKIHAIVAPRDERIQTGKEYIRVYAYVM